MKKLLMMLFFVVSLCACGDRATSTPVEGDSIVVDSVEVVDTLNVAE